MTKPNYLIHDSIYKRLQEKGVSGWSSAMDRREFRNHLNFLFLCRTTWQDAKCLEVGCGAGDHTEYLLELGCDVHGIDISPTAITWAQDKFAAKPAYLGRISFEVADLLSYRPTSENMFDLIVDSHCLHCIIGADRKEFFALARKALTPDGTLYINTMCGDVTDATIVDKFDFKRRLVMHGDIATRYIGQPEDILAEVENEGFVVKAHAIVKKSSAQDQDTLLIHAMIR